MALALPELDPKGRSGFLLIIDHTTQYYLALPPLLPSLRLGGWTLVGITLRPGLIWVLAVEAVFHGGCPSEIS